MASRSSGSTCGRCARASLVSVLVEKLLWPSDASDLGFERGRPGFPEMDSWSGPGAESEPAGMDGVSTRKHLASGDRRAVQGSGIGSRSFSSKGRAAAADLQGSPSSSAYHVPRRTTHKSHLSTPLKTTPKTGWVQGAARRSHQHRPMKATGLRGHGLSPEYEGGF